jgi:hypothetical protein
MAALLRDTAQALDRYQQIANDVHCEDESEPLRKYCEDLTTILAEDVRGAKEKVTRYRLLSNQQPFDLFDIYQSLHTIMGWVDKFALAEELCNGHNNDPAAAAFNNFVKLDGWFGAEVRNTIEHPPGKTCE